MKGTSKNMASFETMAAKHEGPLAIVSADHSAGSPLRPRIRDLATLARAIGGVMRDTVRVTWDVLRGGYEQ